MSKAETIDRALWFYERMLAGEIQFCPPLRPVEIRREIRRLRVAQRIQEKRR